MSASWALLITCEHGGNAVPPEYAPLFATRGELLASHRGFDPGALEMARTLASTFKAPLYAATVTRLLVDLNRSLGHPGLFSAVTKALPQGDRQTILETYYTPHREAVTQAVETARQAGRRVIHIASHSFTPILDGVRRHGDVCLLYDPGRAAEKNFCHDWLHALAGLDAQLVLRRNYPYRGVADGLTTALRRRFGEGYLGIELEVNQRFVAAGRMAHQALTDTLAIALAPALDALATRS